MGRPPEHKLHNQTNQQSTQHYFQYKQLGQMNLCNYLVQYNDALIVDWFSLYNLGKQVSHMCV